MKFPKKKVVYLIILTFVSTVNAQFVHPGIWHKKSDLDRMKYMVEAGIEPWITSFNNLQAETYFSNYNYNVRKDPNDNTLARENPSHQRYQYEHDTRAAYNNALLWYITGDERHAEKAIEILNAWSSLVSFYGGGTEPLSAGIYATLLIETAEIMKHTYDGWEEEDIKKFGDMLVYPGYSNTVVPEAAIAASRNDQADGVTFYWHTYQGDPGRAGNQGLLAWRTVMAIGIFLDNEIIYNRALRQIKGLPHRNDDFAYPSGPGILLGGADRDYTNAGDAQYANVINEHFIDWKHGGRQNLVEDWGYDDQIQHYILENGQCEESSRDQVHSSLGVGAVSDLAEIAWNQGDDIYSYLDDRLLKGIEFTAKYNLSYEKSYPDQLTSWEPTVENGEYIRHTNRTGRREALKINPYVTSNYDRWSRGAGVVGRPIYEMPLAHYTIRENKSEAALWLQRIRDYSVEVNGYEEGQGLDASGWGGLTFHRPEGCAGDPVVNYENGTYEFGIHNIPVIIEAENYDYFAGSTEDRSYHDESLGNTGGEYRNDGSVDIKVCSEGGYNVTNIQNGEWLTYTVNVPEEGEYDLNIRYASANSDGKIKFVLGGQDITPEVSVPHGGSNSLSLNDWKTYKVASGIVLPQGVQALRVEFSGADGSFEINSFSIAIKGIDAASTNLAPEGVATQSTTGFGADANRAIDENTDGEFAGGSYSQTGSSDSNMWWQVDLLEDKTIRNIIVHNRTGFLANSENLNNFTISILNENGDVVFSELVVDYPNPSTSITTGSEGVVGRVVKISKSSSGAISLAEVEVFGYDAPTLSLPSTSLEKELLVYPNPFGTNLFIDNSQGAEVTLFNSLGVIMYRGLVHTDHELIHTEHLSSGIYFIRTNKNGNQTSKKIVKK